MDKEHTGLFISDDEISEYVYKKLKDKGIKVYPFSFVPCSFTISKVFHTGDITGILQYLKKENIKKLVFIGRIPSDTIFKEIHPSSDIFLQGKEPLSGEVILKKLVNFLDKENIEVMSLIEVLRDEIVEEKLYTDVPVDEDEKEDIDRGIEFLNKIMDYRVGQSVVIKKGMIIAVEGIEGTDEMIKRAGRYCNKFVVVKIAGRYKDERFDIPVIGPNTIEVLAEAGGCVIAMEAGRSILFDSLRVINLCNRNKIKLIGVKGVE
ncbi:MAG: LpxI family protein [bacterium]|nr:LpxI family protein [bacterium]